MPREIEGGQRTVERERHGVPRVRVLRAAVEEARARARRRPTRARSTVRPSPTSTARRSTRGAPVHAMPASAAVSCRNTNSSTSVGHERDHPPAAASGESSHERMGRSRLARHLRHEQRAHEEAPAGELDDTRLVVGVDARHDQARALRAARCTRGSGRSCSNSARSRSGCRRRAARPMPSRRVTVERPAPRAST